MYNYLDFEKPVADLEGKIIELKKLAESDQAVDVGEEIARLEKRVEGSAARHLQGADAVAEGAGRPPSRPPALPRLRRKACSAISRRSPATALSARTTPSSAASPASAASRIAVIGQEKGDDTKSRLKHNFGMAKPEGYRKAVRVMELADRFSRAGAQPGRHCRRLSRHQCRGARPGRGDRPLDLGLPGAEGAVAVGHHRRGRLGRRHRDRHGQPRLHAGACRSIR